MSRHQLIRALRATAMRHDVEIIGFGPSRRYPHLIFLYLGETHELPIIGEPGDWLFIRNNVTNFRNRLRELNNSNSTDNTEG